MIQPTPPQLSDLIQLVAMSGDKLEGARQTIFMLNSISQAFQTDFKLMDEKMDGSS